MSYRSWKRGEIYFVHKKDSRSVGSEYEAGRPAVIVSNDANNAHSDVVEVVFLTTAPKKQLPTHTEIMGTKTLSTAVCEQISSVATVRIGNYCGKCSEEEMREIEKCCMVSLGIDPSKYAVAEQPTSTDEKTDTVKATDTNDVVIELNKQLTRMQAERDVYKELYNDLMKVKLAC